MRADQFRAAIDTLGLRRADVASVFGYSWTWADAWWHGRATVPIPVQLLLKIWLHPDFPPHLRPKKGVLYQIDTSRPSYFTRKLPLAP